MRILAFLMTALALCAWGHEAFALPATPTSVLVSPRGARIEVVQELAIQNGQAFFELPGDADMDSLSLRVEGRTVESMTAEQIPPEESAALAGLKTAYDNARRAAAEARADRAATEAQARYWGTSGMRMATVEEAARFDAFMGRRLQEMHYRLAERGLAQEKLDAEEVRARRAYEEAGGRPSKSDATRKDRTDAGNFRIMVHVNPPQTGTARAVYSYRIPDASWHPVYRIDAQPESGLIRIHVDAQVTQATGQNWNNAELALTTAQSTGQLEPGPLRPWLPGPRELRQMASDAAPMLAMKAPAPDAETMMPGMARSNTIVRDDQSNSAIWRLGRQEVPAGRPVTVRLETQERAASFVRLLRPARDERAFLLAELAKGEPLTLPPSKGLFLVNGDAVGSGVFALNGQSEEIFFGVDPFVTARMDIDKGQRGQEGIIDRRQTRTWNWVMDIANAHDKPVAVRVEDAYPESRDENVNVKITSTPAPTRKNASAVWTLTIPAGGTQQVRHNVEISAPRDMDLDPGRDRK